MEPLYIESTSTIINDESHRYTHPITGEVYGRTDYSDPQKLEEIGAKPLRYQDPAQGMVADGWTIVPEGEGFVRRPINEVSPPLPTREEILENTIPMIDLRTHEIITSGFEWNEMTISSSEAAQANFLAIEQIRQRGALTFPIPWSTKDGEGFLIATEEEWLDLLTAKDTFIFFTAKQSGQQLRDQATNLTVEELMVWTDPR